MTYQSVDALQRTLADTVFHYASDRKKASGRALGTLVELITFYALRSWGLRDHILIERSVPEFANDDILHNVEFSLHPIRARHQMEIENLALPLTPAKIRGQLKMLEDMRLKSTQVLTRDGVKRNACVVADDAYGIAAANVDSLNATGCRLSVCELLPDPFAIFECKRVGVEEGMRKGPQTIEKAKQGAYVARAVSALQKVRLRNGHLRGLIEQQDGTIRMGPYTTLLRDLIDSASASDLRGVILTVGVVSNHGNWFTSANPNKELRVLAHSYDWLLFLTDFGLSQFIDMLLLNPTLELEPAREAFLASYAGSPGRNRFTKVLVGIEADEALRSYFEAHEAEIDKWFNVISPRDRDITGLRSDLSRLANKDWLGV